MAYEKIDTPRLNGTNMFLVYVYNGIVYTHNEPTITTYTGIKSCRIDGNEEYTDTNTGLTLKPSVVSGVLTFDYIYKEPDDGPRTGSSITTIVVSSIGDAEYKSADITYSIGVVCCMVPLSVGIVSTHDIPVSGLTKTIDLFPAKFIEDVYDGSTSDVIFNNNSGVLEGVPDSPGAYIGKVSDTFEPIKGVASSIVRPANIAIKDTRVYTDQEYVLAVDDPTTVTVDRSAVKIHNLSDGSENIPFSENPGNGFYLSCPTSSSSPGTVTYTDDAGDVHTYDIDRVYPGYDNLEDAEHNCQYFRDGSCTYGKSVCAHTLGIRKPTDSSWGLYHNGTAVDDVDTVYNSEYPPSFGWAKSTITGEAEIQYNGVPYTYLASYDSLTYKPEKGSCVELAAHRMQFYGVKESVSKTLKGWGAYGGPASQPHTLSIISYDTVTKKYAPGYRTSLIDVSDSTILKGVSPITGAALLTHPITSSYLDNAVYIGRYGVGSGYGTGSGPYGVAVPDTILPTYDWAQFYLNRPRQSSIDTNTKITGSVKYNGDSRIAVKWWHKYSRLQDKTHSGPNHTTLDTRQYDSEPLNCSAYKGILTKEKEKDVIDIEGTIYLPDISSSMPLYKSSLDLPTTFVGVGRGDLEYTLDKGSILGELKAESEHGGLRFNKYIVFQNILYETSDDIAPIWCSEFDSLCTFDTKRSDDTEYCYRLLKTWGSITSLSHLKGIKVAVEDGSNKPVISNGKLSLGCVTLDDLYTYNKDGYNYVSKDTYIRTLYDTPSSINAYLVHKVYRDGYKNITAMHVDHIEYRVDYGEFGEFTIGESEITPVRESDLVKTYNITIEHTTTYSNNTSVTRADEYGNGGTYYINCDDVNIDDWCTGSPCSEKGTTTHTIRAPKSYAIDARTGYKPYGFTPGSSATHNVHWSESPYCNSTEDGEWYEESGSGSYVLSDVRITMGIASPSDIISDAFRFDDSDSQKGPYNGEGYSDLVRKTRVNIDRQLCPRIYVYGGGSSYGTRYDIGLTQKTGYGAVGRFEYDFTGSHWSDGGGILEYFKFTWDSSFDMHTYDNDEDPDIKCSTRISCNRSGGSFELSPENGVLGLYLPSPGTVTTSSNKSCTETEKGNGKYGPASSVRTTTDTTTVTIEESDDLSNSTSSESTVPIVCYVSGGKAITAEYKSYGDIVDTYDKIDKQKVVHSLGINPFEAPIKSSSKYRGITASGNTHILSDIETSNSLHNPKYILSLDGDCSIKYKAPTGDNKWDFLCDNDMDYWDTSYSDAGSVSATDTLNSPTKQSIDISDVCAKPFEIPIQKLVHFSIPIGSSDSSVDLFDIDYDYYELNYKLSETENRGVDIESSLTVVWSSRPAFDDTVNYDDTGNTHDILLPVVRPDDRSIYKSEYAANTIGPGVKCSTKVDCLKSPFKSVLGLASVDLDIPEQDNTYDNSNSGSSDCMTVRHFTNCVYKAFIPKINDPDVLRTYIQDVLKQGSPFYPPMNTSYIPPLHTAVPTIYPIKEFDGSDSLMSYYVNILMKPIRDGIVIARRHDFT